MPLNFSVVVKRTFVNGIAFVPLSMNTVRVKERWVIYFGTHVVVIRNNVTVFYFHCVKINESTFFCLLFLSSGVKVRIHGFWDVMPIPMLRIRSLSPFLTIYTVMIEAARFSETSVSVH